MDDILELARQLGKRIAEHPRGKAFREASQALANDSAAQTLLKELNEQARHVQMLETQNKPVEPEDKRKLADAQQRVAGNPCLSNCAKAHADYVEMMQQVSAAIENPDLGKG